MIRVLSVVDPTRVYPHRKRRKRPVVLAASAAVVLAVSGCGGGGGNAQSTAGTGQTVAGPGFSFRTPEGWAEKVLATSASASQDASTLVAVTVLPLVKAYRPALFPRVVQELDRVAAAYASSLKGTVTSRRTVTVAGRKARVYRIEHGDLVDRIAFLLRGKRNYQLTCRWRRADGEPAACAQLVSSFAFR
jgi:hypothetical protein